MSGSTGPSGRITIGGHYRLRRCSVHSGRGVAGYAAGEAETRLSHISADGGACGERTAATFAKGLVVSFSEAVTLHGGTANCEFGRVG